MGVALPVTVKTAPTSAVAMKEYFILKDVALSIRKKDVEDTGIAREFAYKFEEMEKVKSRKHIETFG